MSKTRFSENREELFPERTSSFWDYLCDMYGHPGTLELYVPVAGEEGRRQDAERIRSYSRKSPEKLLEILSNVRKRK